MKRMLCIMVLLLVVPAMAQQAPITEKEKNEAIDSIALVLTKYYIFPEKARQTADYLFQQRRSKVYKKLSTYGSFIDQVNKDLQAVHKDLHLTVSYNPQKADLIRKLDNKKPDSTLFVKRIARHRYHNYGVYRVERLAGNITYIDLREFVTVSDESKKSIDAALTMNPEPQAIIVDLRENGGGVIDMGRYISSYFFKDPVPLSNVTNKITNTTVSYRTDPGLASQKFIDTPLYLLTSGNTFSAAEEFAYSLQALKRAVVIGETSAGGAHGYGSKAIGSAMVIGIPYERIENAVTKTNWEGTGIAPDILTPASKALEKAHLLALETVPVKQDNEEAVQEIRWKKEHLQAVIKPVALPEDLLQSYAGTYGTRRIDLACGELYLLRKDNSRFRLLPINETTFYINELNYRLEFLKVDGARPKLYIIFEDGYRQEIG